MISEGQANRQTHDYQCESGDLACRCDERAAWREQVVLICKNRPTWQAGRLNGVGGKIEPGEGNRMAMVREFEEETGLKTEPGKWDLICTMTWPDDWKRVGRYASPSIDFYRYVWPDDTFLSSLVRTCTDEEIVIELVEHVGNRRVIPNLRWLVPLAAYTADRYEPFTILATVAETIESTE